jgi:hypothetical protein
MEDKDVEIINKFLNRNYYVSVNETDFIIKDFLNEDKILNIDRLIDLCKKYFGSINYIQHLNSWFYNKKSALVKDLDDFLKKNQNVTSLLKKFKLKFKKEYDEKFLKKYFDDFIYETLVNPNLISFIEKKNNIGIDVTRVTQLKLVDEFFNTFNYVPSKSKHISNEIKVRANYEIEIWYTNLLSKETINDLFKQFVVTLGLTNWKVTWIGHGEMTEKRFLSLFKNASKQKLNEIRKEYDDWLEKKILLMSEKIMHKNLD